MPILRALLGLAFFCFVAWLLSSNRRKVNTRIIVAGIGMQILLGAVILKTDWGNKSLQWVSNQAATILSFGEVGSEMVFGPMTGFYYEPEWDEDATGDAKEDPTELAFYTAYPGHLFAEGAESKDINIVSLAFKGLTTIIYFSAVMAILYYLGVMQRIIAFFARVMTKTMGVSGAESLAMSANVFVGQTEAPLVVKPYINGMTKSELMALMTGGFATIAGSVLAVYIGILGRDFAGHLLAASFMSAPAAFVMAKIMIPETQEAATTGMIQLASGKVDGGPTNLIDAAARGIGDGLKLFLNVMAMLIGFVAMVALVNYFLGVFTVGEDLAGEGIPLSLERIFGWVFAPVAWLMGVDGWSQCQAFGSLLGVKIGVNEFVAFGDLATAQAEGALNPRHAKMAAYALCGFANFSSIGIQLGGISPLAPDRRGELASFAVKAMLGGAFASWMTATIAGMFL